MFHKTALFFTIAIVLLQGCTSAHTALSKRDLLVRTQMSRTIFLDPVAADKKRVFIQVKNTFGNRQLDLQAKLAYALINKGYTLVLEPQKAYYWLQINVLEVDKANANEIDSALTSGFGGGLIGAAAAGLAGGDSRTVLGLGLAGAAIGVAANAFVKDTYYIIVTDVQLSERSEAQVTEKLTSHRQGINASKMITATEKTPWKRYQTRVISTANKVNLTLEEALGELEAGLVNSIAGLM